MIKDQKIEQQKAAEFATALAEARAAGRSGTSILQEVAEAGLSVAMVKQMARVMDVAFLATTSADEPSEAPKPKRRRRTAQALFTSMALMVVLVALAMPTASADAFTAVRRLGERVQFEEQLREQEYRVQQQLREQERQWQRELELDRDRQQRDHEQQRLHVTPYGLIDPRIRLR